MKTNEIKKMEINVQNLNGLTASEIGDDHISTSLETPMRKNAFKIKCCFFKLIIFYYILYCRFSFYLCGEAYF